MPTMPVYQNNFEDNRMSRETIAFALDDKNDSNKKTEKKKNKQYPISKSRYKAES